MELVKISRGFLDDLVYIIDGASTERLDEFVLIINNKGVTYSFTKEGGEKEEWHLTNEELAESGIYEFLEKTKDI